MKTLKIILFAVIGIIALALVAAMFVKEDYAVEKEVIINKPKAEVFNYVKYLKNQNNFSVWASMDPHMKKTFKGTDGTTGFVSAWQSKNEDVGTGEQTIINVVEGQRIDYMLRFIEPFESSANAYMATESVDSTHTKVKWGFSGKMEYPTNLTLVFMSMDQMIGKDFETGLNNLKGILEK
ncbi:SRPBCC family protein [Emticicia fluvialis]|uniref:SRPBCC family protein n=1 Tax=Emticicia fluvialis TaxID=2974474 RepID=UPI0021659E9C|nr:SRPBCC family protein [Emticicia fluvialis]